VVVESGVVESAEESAVALRACCWCGWRCGERRFEHCQWCRRGGCGGGVRRTRVAAVGGRMRGSCARWDRRLGRMAGKRE